MFFRSLCIISVIVTTFTVSFAQKAVYVSPNGDDKNDGATAKTAFKTIQHGLDTARPGTVINLAPGIYRESLKTKVSGTEASPIIIRGTDDAKVKDKRYKTVLYGSGRIVSVDHSYYRFEGFAIDGQEALAGKEYPSDPNKIIAFKDENQSVMKDGRLIYIGSDDASRELTGIRIVNMYLRGAGGECVRIRNAAHHNEIANSVIEYCGMFAKGDGTERYKYHNAEAVYIGTSPKSTTQPMHKNDTSNMNIVHGNIIHTYGSECFNIKENAHHNIFVGNECKFNLEPADNAGSNVELRGDNNLVEANLITDSFGVNVKLKADAPEYDKGGNIIRNNTLARAQKGNISNDLKASVICGNKLDSKMQRGTTQDAAAKPCESNSK